jgi:hypothetical protein
LLEGTSATLMELQRVGRENRELQAPLDALTAQLNKKLEQEAELEAE